AGKQPSCRMATRLTALLLLLAPVLAAQTAPPAHNLYPRWSPDGKRLVFSSTRDGNEEIYVMNADGSGQTRLTRNLQSDRQPAWSPDGATIIFQSMRGDSFGGRLDAAIYTMKADGSDQKRLSPGAGPDITPRFSPDGKRVLFVRGTFGNYTLMVANA